MKQIRKETAMKILALDDIAVIKNELLEQGNCKRLQEILENGWLGYKVFSISQLQYLINSKFPGKYKIKD
jgi:hypothetical protein